MHEADIDEGEPGQRRRNQQQPGGDQFGRARSRRRRLDRVMIVMAVTVGCMIVMRIRGMGVDGIGAMRVVMMLDGVAARVARMRAEDRDQASEYGADQRQKDDCLDH